jgi:ATP-dependent RNA helicase UAP56/SUB2
MSHENEELIDYEDEHDIPNGATGSSATNGASASAALGEGDKDKKNFSGIHSTGFRCVQAIDHFLPAHLILTGTFY